MRQKLSACFITLIAGACSLCCVSSKVAHSRGTSDCGKLLNAFPDYLFDSTHYFKSDLADFLSDTTYDYQVLYIISPDDEDVGFIVSAKMLKDSVLVKKGPSNRFNTRKVAGSELFRSILNIEKGGFSRLCNDEPGTYHFYVCLVRSKHEVLFRYQSLNRSLESEFAEGLFPEMKKLLSQLKETT